MKSARSRGALNRIPLKRPLARSGRIVSRSRALRSEWPGDPTVNGIVPQPLAFAMLHWITRLSDTLPAAFVVGARSLLLVLFTWTGSIFFRPIVKAWLCRQGGRCDHPSYRLGVIRAAVYGTEPIATFGPVAGLVATAKLDAAMAASLTRPCCRASLQFAACCRRWPNSIAKEAGCVLPTRVFKIALGAARTATTPFPSAQKR